MAARPRVVAALAAQFRDLDAAEEGFDAAVERLLASGTRPEHVAAFLFVAGKRKILDARRRSTMQRMSRRGPKFSPFPNRSPTSD